jgi:hypothetical protein
MNWLSKVDHFVEDSVAATVNTAEAGLQREWNDIRSDARVTATVAEGAYEFAIHNPGYVAKSAAIALGTGALVGVAMAALPEVAAVGAVVGVAGIALGAIGATSLGVQTYDAFKSAMPDLKIVYDADHHSAAEVKAAEQAVEAKTGEAVANVGLLVPTYFLGNFAGNLGADAVLAGRGSAALAAAADGTDEAMAAVAADSGVNAATSAGAADMAESCPAPQTSTLSNLWNFLNHNPLEELPHPNSWMRLNNSTWFGVESNYWVERADLRAVGSLPFRLLPSEVSSEIPKQVPKSQGTPAAR